MNKQTLFSSLLSVFAGLILISSIYSCSETPKTDSLKGEISTLKSKKVKNLSCCTSGIPARFPVKSSVER